ncbi:uncharacterized protein [Bemisia tabaci]|uniref:uncharacterized protein isoform X2 n=1 Tax=Bemisia tabaci TaxID=7038 RepID=UPI003B2870BB
MQSSSTSSEQLHLPAWLLVQEKIRRQFRTVKTEIPLRKRRNLDDNWRYKLMLLHLRVYGLNIVYTRDDLLSKFIVTAHFVFLFLEVIFCFQCLTAIVFHIAQGQIVLRELIMHLQFTVLTLTIIVKGTILVVKKAEIAECLFTRLDLRLHCTAEFDEGTTGKAYASAHNIVLLVYIVSIQVTGLMAAVVSPLLRFYYSKKNSTYVLRPIWYPWDMIASRPLFWFAAVYEVILIYHTIHICSCADLMFMHFMITASERFNTLGKYLMRGVPATYQVEIACSERINNNLLLMQNHIFDDRLKNLEEGRLKKGIDDYNVLWRHLNNIKSIFMQWANFSVLGGMTTITMMTFAALTEFLKSDKSGKAITQGVVFLSYVMSAVLVMFTFYYSATLLQESVE